MSSPLIDLSDAVTGALEAETWSMEIEVERSYQPILELENLANLEKVKVDVVPRGQVTTRLSRSQWDRVYQVAVLVRSKPAGMANADLDDLMELVEEISEFFRATYRPLTTMQEFACVSVEHDPCFLPDHLDELRQFTSLVVLNFREQR
jgi:hypothetical protein